MGLTDESLMPFGQHKGKKLVNVPDTYLMWLYENNKAHGDLKEYIEDNLDVIKKESVNQRKFETGKPEDNFN